MTPSVKNNKKLLPLIKRDDVVLREVTNTLEKTLVSGFESNGRDQPSGNQTNTNAVYELAKSSMDGQASAQTAKNKKISLG